MDDKRDLIAVLERVYAVEARSLVAYLSLEADLLLDQSTPDARTLFEDVRAATVAHMARLEELVMEEGGQVDPLPYDMSLMRFNYVTADHIIPNLVDSLDDTIRGLEEGAAFFAGWRNDLESVVRGFADRRRGQLDTARGMLPPPPAPVPEEADSSAEAPGAEKSAPAPKAASPKAAAPKAPAKK